MKVFEKPGKLKLTGKLDGDDGYFGGENGYENEMRDGGESEYLKAEEIDLEHPSNGNQTVPGSFDVDSSTNFDLEISNAHLSKLYNYNACAAIPQINDLNLWLKNNILIWDVESKQITFNFPKTSTPLIHDGNFQLQNKNEVVPKTMLNKQKTLFQTIPPAAAAIAPLASLTSGPSLLQQNQAQYSSPSQLLANHRNHANSTQRLKSQPTIVYQGVYDDLNSTQRSEIWNTSTFTIHYEHGESELWALRPWVFYGKVRSSTFLKKMLGYAKFQFLQVKRRFYTPETVELILSNRKNPHVNAENCECTCLDINILEGLRVMIGVPFHLIILLIGIPLYQLDETRFEAAKLKQIQTRIENAMKSVNGVRYCDLAFFHHLAQHKEIYLQPEFNIQEDQELINLVKQIHEGTLTLNMPEDSKDLVKLYLYDKMYEEVLKRVKAHLANTDTDAEVIKSFENTYKSYLAMHKHVFMSRRYQLPQYSTVESALKELKRINCPKQHDLIDLITSELIRGVSIFESRSIKTKIRTYSKTNLIEFTRFVPVIERVQLEGNNNNNNNAIYRSSWTSVVSITTSFFFWKIAFFFAGAYFMIQKFMNSCYYYAIYSGCGLKAALYSKPFSNAFIVNTMTGKIEDDPRSLEETVTSHFNLIKQQARDNVERFENEPDHGLLGKSITRLCNRLENWVFLYFIVGFILVNIFKRILYILCGLFFLLLVPLSLLIAPVYTVLCAIVCIFFYDFTVPSNHVEWDLPLIVPIFDLLLWRIFGRGLGQICLSVLMIAFHIVFGIILVIAGIVIYVIRRILDSLVFIFIYSCGRIPGGDSYLAWRTRTFRNVVDNSPGTRRSNHHTAAHASGSIQMGTSLNKGEQSQVIDQLSAEQIQCLIDSEIDRHILTVFQTEMYTKITAPVLKNDSMIKNVLSYLPFEFSMNRLTRQYSGSANQLVSILDSQIVGLKRQLPYISRKSVSNFSYKRENLMQIYYGSQTYIQDKFSANGMFQKLIWDHMKCEVGNYAALTLSFFNLIFFEGKQPLAQVLEKLTLKDSPNKANQIKQQIDEFLTTKYNITNKIKEPPSFVSFHTFISKTIAQQGKALPMVNLKLDQFHRLEEFILINVRQQQGGGAVAVAAAAGGAQQQ